MAAALDHLILQVNDADASVRFYCDVLGFRDEGRDEPFAVVRVSESLTLQLAAWGTSGGTHLAFALEPAEFDACFERVRSAGIPYGDRFDAAENMQGPGGESGARGPGPTLYFFDPNRHLIEIRCYPAA